MTLTYHLYDKDWRNTVDWNDYRIELEDVISLFPMIELVEVTHNDFTIDVNTSNVTVKNRVVKALGRKLASDPTLSEFTVYRYGSFRLIVEKK